MITSNCLLCVQLGNMKFAEFLHTHSNQCLLSPILYILAAVHFKARWQLMIIMLIVQFLKNIKRCIVCVSDYVHPSIVYSNSNIFLMFMLLQYYVNISLFYFLPFIILFIFFTIIIDCCNITVLGLLWHRNVPVCRTNKGILILTFSIFTNF